MKTLATWLVRGAEFVAAMMMAAMFLTFILQILVRYSAPFEGLARAVPLLEPSRYGWTLEFCLALWVWIIFWGAAFVVRERDHVTFDMVYGHVSPRTRTWFAIIGSLAVCAGLLWSLEPTWSKFHILRLKKTATLNSLVGDWVRMRDIYSIYMVFLVAVSMRYAWRAWAAFRHGADAGLHRGDEMVER
ncbi:TRAP transporter small permease subunit [uncultured Hoeflea sp.]|uniref:TRAP transporter small permease n=1 Tax=uncultured Hoeflea sp. TaxID=538666 RepID=UPI00260555D3|nr:TRAP transporter small permease subunit [uncultured Hoeflea sp.]